jgi:hypothetical protein
MGLVLTNFASLVGSYLVLRNITLATTTKEQTAVMITVAGFISWFFIFSVAAWVLLTLYLIFALVVLGSLGAIYGLVFIGFFSGMAFQFNEVLDAGVVLYYIRETAFFRPMKPKSMIFQEELDKKEMRDIHREIADTPFPVMKTQKRLPTEKELQKLQRELHALRQRPARSDRFNNEIRSLKSGAITSIADPWKVYTFDHKFHDWYAEMSHVEIDPARRAAQFRLNVPNASEKALQDAMYVFRLKQELYQLLQVLNTDPWLLWYNEYFDRFLMTLYGVESDSFGHTQLFVFMKIEILRAPLTEREGRFFNAADLHTISAIAFNHGSPLPEKP